MEEIELLRIEVMRLRDLLSECCDALQLHDHEEGTQTYIALRNALLELTPEKFS